MPVHTFDAASPGRLVRDDVSAQHSPAAELSDRARWAPIAALIVVLTWTLLILSVGALRFATYSPTGEVGEEAATALAALFGALVLTLFPSGSDATRLRWVAAGFAVLGCGALLFGYLLPLAAVSMPLNTTMYTALAVRIAVGCLLVIGLLPARPPALTHRRAAIVCLAVVVLIGAISLMSPQLPVLVNATRLQLQPSGTARVLPGLTVWHWLLSSLSLLLTLSAVVGAAWHSTRRALDAWLLTALICLCGSQLHNIVWPSTYTGVLTTSNLLRLAFALLLSAGAVLELRHIAEERATLLEAAEEHGRQLEELRGLKASFTAMVAHELGSPLAAIRATTAVLATGALGSREQAKALQTIDTQVDMLTALTADMQEASTMERSEFGVRRRPVPASLLITDAYSYARTLPGEHPLEFPPAPQEVVLADTERIGQVLRNLLSNAAKYSGPRTPIALQLARRGHRLRFTVRDEGYGIHPDDMQRIFEKFGRGRDRSGRRVPGVGLGLYLSRQIVQLHGGELSVESRLDRGSAFSFELEVVA